MLLMTRQTEKLFNCAGPEEIKVARILAHCGFAPADTPGELRDPSSSYSRCRTAHAVWLAMQRVVDGHSRETVSTPGPPDAPSIQRLVPRRWMS